MTEHTATEAAAAQGELSSVEKMENANVSLGKLVQALGLLGEQARFDLYGDPISTSLTLDQAPEPTGARLTQVCGSISEKLVCLDQCLTSYRELFSRIVPSCEQTVLTQKTG